MQLQISLQKTYVEETAQSATNTSNTQLLVIRLGIRLECRRHGAGMTQNQHTSSSNVCEY